MHSFLKYSGLMMVSQLLACIMIWLLALLFSPTLDFLFELMVYSYWPTVYLVGLAAHSGGESAMFAAVVFGIIIGIFAYGIIFGAAVSFIKKTRLL